MNNPTMKILLVSHTADLYGAERSLLDLARGLHAQGIDFTVLFPETGPLTAVCTAEQIPWLVLPLLRPQKAHVARFLAGWWPRVWQLRQLIRQQGFTLVYNNTLDGLYAPFAARLAGVPCVWHVREVKPRSAYGRSVFAALLRTLPTVTLFASQATLNAYRLIGNTQPATWQVIHNGVRINQTALTQPKEAKESLVVGFAGQFVPLKRPWLFLQAIAMAQPQVPHLQAVMVGDGPLQGDMVQLAERLGIRPLVAFRGYQTDMTAFYAELDCLLLTSERESFARVLIEAMSVGCPVVAADVGGVSESVVDGVTGYLIHPATDVAQYAARIVQLAHNPLLRHQLGQQGQAHVQAHFSVERYQAQLTAVFRALHEAKS